MESPRPRYIKGHGFSSSSKSSFASNKHGRSTKASKHSNRSEHSSKFNRHTTSHELPLHLKRPFKMSIPASSSPKRPRSGKDSSERPAKQQKVDEKTLHGIEDVLSTSPVLGPLAQPIGQIHVLYSRRIKVTSYARAIRQNRLLSKKVKGGILMKVPVQKGMSNLTGALCYRHSLFQALMHVPKFVNWLLLDHDTQKCLSEDSKHCVACNLRDIAIAYSTLGDNLREDLIITHKSFKINGWESVGGSGQGDPEEQLTWIKLIMQTQLPAMDFLQFRAFQSLVCNSNIKCRCGYASITLNHLTGPLPLDLLPRIRSGHLTEYIHRHFIEEISGYKCDKCGNKDGKKRIQEIFHLPDLLLVQLKRFSYDGKIMDKVIFDETLSLNRFRAAGSKDNGNYELAAVVAHSGTKDDGHYICFAKDSHGKWHRFNDSSVVPVNVRDALSPRHGFTPNLLFYQRLENN